MFSQRPETSETRANKTVFWTQERGILILLHEIRGPHGSEDVEVGLLESNST